MSNDYSYSRGRPPAESISRIADWDINDSIIPRVNLIYTYIFLLVISKKCCFALFISMLISKLFINTVQIYIKSDYVCYYT